MCYVCYAQPAALSSCSQNSRLCCAVLCCAVSVLIRLGSLSCSQETRYVIDTAWTLHTAATVITRLTFRTDVCRGVACRYLGFGYWYSIRLTRLALTLTVRVASLVRGLKMRRKNTFPFGKENLCQFVHHGAIATICQLFSLYRAWIEICAAILLKRKVQSRK